MHLDFLKVFKGALKIIQFCDLLGETNKARKDSDLFKII